jgi:hypothetical protein
MPGPSSYSHNNVLCSIMLVFVISFIIGCVTGWIACHNCEMNRDKSEIRDQMTTHKSKIDTLHNAKKQLTKANKMSNSSKAEGSMHSQAPDAGGNLVERMHHQNGEDPDRMMVDRMEPSDLTIAQSRKSDGKNLPFDRRHIDTMADNPDDKLLQAFESPFSSWRNNQLSAEGSPWN